MNFDRQIIFFLSALGAFNGFLLFFYFAFNAKRKKFSNYFLAFLLLVLSIRITKSVFFYFSPQLSGIFIQIGLSACILIGPFLYLYLKSQIVSGRTHFAYHIFPALFAITILGIVYPYVENRAVWSRLIVKGIYVQWFIYIAAAFTYIKPQFKGLFMRGDKINTMDLWYLSIYLGVTIIWLGYSVGSYTSYIIGALSFSFVFYLVVLLFTFRSDKDGLFLADTEKYKNRKLDSLTKSKLDKKINIIIENKLFLNPDLTLSETAKELNVSAHILSQFLNENMGKSFSQYINEFRVETAKELLANKQNFSIESLGYESGFNSKSSFYATFKKITSQTPAEFRKVHTK